MIGLMDGVCDGAKNGGSTGLGVIGATESGSIVGSWDGTDDATGVDVDGGPESGSMVGS